MSSLKSGKSPGLDMICAELLKAASSTISPILLRIFNNILQTGQYPTMWTQGAISPVHKKGSVDIPDNYRGITVTSTMSKLFGIMMNNRLTSFCTKHAIIDERQCSHKKLQELLTMFL